jgi:YebC/PmpR family DNA-binding regulatory protein
MAGHSQFKNIMHRKGAQDKKRAKLFNKLAREITVSAKAGLSDPAANPRLRAAISAARAANMPNSRIQSALSSALPGAQDNVHYEEVRYEGYAAGGVAVIVEALTDNRNRTAGEVRMAFSKNGGVLGETGSVSFMFKKIGQITYPFDIGSADAVFEMAVDAGAENVISEDGAHTVETTLEDFSAVRENLEKKCGGAQSSGLLWKPMNTVAVSGEEADDVMALIEALEDNDDVQNVFANFELAEDEMMRMMAHNG